VSSIPLIAGIGLSTALGNTAAETWDSLCAGRFITDHARVPDVDDTGEPRVNVLGRRVAREAIAQAGWSAHDLRSAALIVGTSKGSVDAWLESLAPGISAMGHPLAFGLADTAATVAVDLEIAGPRLTLSAACASGLVALIRGVMMIRAGEVSRVLVIASESSLHPLFVASFKRLGVIPPPGHGCRPFDRSRSGFVISEAAAAVCLQASDNIAAVARPLAAVEHFALGADATHFTSGDPSGTTLRNILHRVVAGREVDLIHAHGTGTVFNDPIELAAIGDAVAGCDVNRPNLYSHKGAIGHSLGAAGLVSIAINCLCRTRGIIPPNVQTRDPLPTTNVDILAELRHRAVRRSVALASGFGGTVAAVTLNSVARAARP
jgi:3-oxoacyl-[acyl-carrier-protein] synthase II